MHRFFVDGRDIFDGKVTLHGKNAAHGAVLRLNIGEQIVVCDGAGRDYFCVVDAIEKGQIFCKVRHAQDSAAEPKMAAVTLFQALPKGDKLSEIVEKCVELGVSRIVPFVAERSITRPSSRDSKKIERLRAVAESAAKQSGRGRIPIIEDVVDLREAIAIAKQHDAAFACYESEDKLTLRDLLRPLVGGQSELAFFVGPEGGFTLEEVSMFLDNKIPTISLGPRILRTETAGPATLANILYELEA